MNLEIFVQGLLPNKKRQQQIKQLRLKKVIELGPGPGALAEKLSRWQDRYGVLFAVRVRILLRSGAVAVQV